MQNAPQEVRTFLLTAVTAQRRRLFQVTERAELLMQLLQEDRVKSRYALHGFVIMPDHVHLLLTPAADVSLEKAAQFVKGGFSFRLKSKMDVWERSYDNRRIVDELHFDTSLRYVEENPVRAGLAKRAQEYPYSSCGRGELVDPRPLWFGRG